MRDAITSFFLLEAVKPTNSHSLEILIVLCDKCLLLTQYPCILTKKRFCIWVGFRHILSSHNIFLLPKVQLYIMNCSVFRTKCRSPMRSEHASAIWTLKHIIKETSVDTRNPKTTILTEGTAVQPVMLKNILFSLDILQCKLLAEKNVSTKC